VEGLLNLRGCFGGGTNGVKTSVSAFAEALLPRPLAGRVIGHDVSRHLGSPLIAAESRLLAAIWSKFFCESHRE